MAKDACAHLRRMTRSANHEADKRDRDNTAAVVAYMLERGAFAGWNVSADTDVAEYVAAGAIMSSRESHLKIEFRHDTLPGVEWNRKNRRIRSLALYRKVPVYVERKRGAPRYMGETYEHVETVEVPHWDYCPAYEIHDDGLPPVADLREAA